MSTITLPAPAAPATGPSTREVAARAVNARKTYGRGESEVNALDGVDARFYAGRVHGDHGPAAARASRP